MFCDFENIALGVREARYSQFDMEKVLERLLAKGSIVVKKAYCDWERYKEFKATMHAASFELIEIPHVRQSGKNSADIRMVVDALDLCYTKSHVDTFVIVSGDSDFSPLVSKLRENAKTVIGVGVKNSSSDLLINNCDEFIYYDDLVRADEQKRRAAKKRREAAPTGASGDKSNGDKKQEAFDLMLSTLEALMAERDADERIWGSMVKQALKRRNRDSTSRTMASVPSPTSSRKPKRKASSSSKPTRSPAATWSGPPSRTELQAAAGKGLRDVIAPGLKVVFCGINPGLYSAATGFHFARPGNRFWPALHAAGFTPRLFTPPRTSGCSRSVGLTNLVNRGTAAADELSSAELIEGGGRSRRKCDASGRAPWRLSVSAPTAARSVARGRRSGCSPSPWKAPKCGCCPVRAA